MFVGVGVGVFCPESTLSAACICVGVGPSAGGKIFAPDHKFSK